MSLNGWLYVYGNPVNLTDPSGKISCEFTPFGCNTFMDTPMYPYTPARSPVDSGDGGSSNGGRNGGRRGDEDEPTPPAPYLPTPTQDIYTGPFSGIMDALDPVDLEPTCLIAAAKEFCDQNPRHPECRGGSDSYVRGPTNDALINLFAEGEFKRSLLGENQVFDVGYFGIPSITMGDSPFSFDLPSTGFSFRPPTLNDEGYFDVSYDPSGIITLDIGALNPTVTSVFGDENTIYGSGFSMRIDTTTGPILNLSGPAWTTEIRDYSYLVESVGNVTTYRYNAGIYIRTQHTVEIPAAVGLVATLKEIVLALLVKAAATGASNPIP